MKYPAMNKVYKASDTIVDGKKTVASVMEYWAWAHSDLMDNAERGALAEFLVAKAVGDKSDHRVNWDRYDVTSDEGITIEVKTSAYLQSWGQDKLSVLNFGIGKTYGYDNKTNSYENERKRQADVYVFCVFKEKDQENVNVLDTSQWDFYVLSVKRLNEDTYYADRKSISLAALLKLGAEKCSYENIHEEVLKAHKYN